MVGKVTNAGYRMVVLTIDHKKQYHNVHRIIAKAFIPNPQEHREVNHKDGNKLNNSVQNLEWVTTRKNQIHVRDNGLSKKLKLDKTRVKEIRNLYATGKYTTRQLAKIYNVGKTLIGDIIRETRWKIEE